MTQEQYELLILKFKEAYDILWQVESNAIVEQLKSAVANTLVLLSVCNPQGFIKTASGESLDRVAMPYGFKRLGRTDEEFREHIKEHINEIDELNGRDNHE